jgi:hypothetical protein
VSALRGNGRAETGYAWGVLQRRFGTVIPPYPGPDVIQPLLFDRLPPLDRTLSLDRLVDVCCEAYRSVVVMFFGASRELVRGQGAAHLKCGTAREGRAMLARMIAPVRTDLDRAAWAADGEHELRKLILRARTALGRARPPPGWRVRSSRKYNAVATAALVLIDEALSPIAWAAFACEAWAAVVTPQLGEHLRGNPPALSWVYAARRIELRAEMCRTNGAARRLTWSGEVQRELVVRWNAMRDELVRVQPDDEGGVHLVLLKHFPIGDGYNAAVTRARAELDSMRELASGLLAGGTALW